MKRGFLTLFLKEVSSAAMWMWRRQYINRHLKELSTQKEKQPCVYTQLKVSLEAGSRVLGAAVVSSGQPVRALALTDVN